MRWDTFGGFMSISILAALAFIAFVASIPYIKAAFACVTMFQC